MDFIKTEEGMLTILTIALATSVAFVAFAFCNALHNITVTGF